MRYAIFPVLVIVASFAASVAVEAKEWKRQGSVTTQKGTYTTQGSGACAGQACSRSGSTTGPNGKSVTTSGSVARTDTGVTGTRTVTGPNGGTVTRGGTVTVTPSSN
jgi:hypothetical protein